MRRYMYFLVCFVGLGLMAVDLMAQQPTPPTQQILRIRRMPRLGRGLLERTPVFNATGSSAARRPREWVHFAVSVDTAPEWIDELTFTYHVITQIQGETQFSLYQTTVRYADIPRGQDHQSSVFLLPSATERFGVPIAMAVEIAHGGEVVAADSVSSLAALEGEWWKNPRVTDSPNVVKRDGYLLDRSRTPFALINWDEYLVVR
jgi:hypothetical protein